VARRDSAVTLAGAAVRAHILAIVAGIVQENPFYMPPAVEKSRREDSLSGIAAMPIGECSLCRG
jgi:phosphoribosylcarboxyaminoimidazole (NCAIR) mutase